MDVVWDQDVRTILAAIISNDAIAPDDEKKRGQIDRAVRYADLLEEVRKKKSRMPPIEHRRYGGTHR